MPIKTTEPFSFDEANSVIRYDSSTGEFFWISARGCKKAGSLAGHKRRGYVDILLYRRSIRAGRLAVLLMTGKWPDGEVDHIDGNGHNNRWCNLRVVDRTTNVQNTKRLKRTNTSGSTGVRMMKRQSTWTAVIRVNGRKIVLGSFKDKWVAESVYKKAKAYLHPGYVI